MACIFRQARPRCRLRLVKRVSWLEGRTDTSRTSFLERSMSLFDTIWRIWIGHPSQARQAIPNRGEAGLLDSWCPWHASLR
jgi:hypothetical protein